jgi:hypothetical protein
MAPKTARQSGTSSQVEIDEDARAIQIESFRAWLKDEIAHDSRSLHAIEVSAGIRGNALGKFLRGERGARHSLTPLMIRRLAPVLGLGEDAMLARAGHMSHEPGRVSIVEAINADPALTADDKRFLIEVYRRATSANRA